MADNLSVFAYLMLNYGSLGHRLTSLQIDFVACESWQSANIYESWSRLRVLKLHAGCDNTKQTKSMVLSIQTGVIDQRNLLALYERHRDTLQTLIICDFHLSAGTWQELLAELSADTDRCNFIVEALTHGDGWSIETVAPFCHRKRL